MDLKKPFAIQIGEHNSERNGNTSEIMFTLKANTRLYVSMPMNGINTHAKSTGKTSETKNSMKEISQKYQQRLFPITTYSLQACLASLIVLLGSEKDSTILEGLSSLIYAGLRKLRSLAYFYLKTSRGYSITMGGKLSELSSIRFQNWGMTVNGKCLTARISESHKTGRECSLSDILEEKVDKKYFLSEKQTKHIQRVMEGKAKYHQQDKIYNPKIDKPNLPAGTHGSTSHLMKIWQDL